MNRKERKLKHIMIRKWCEAMVLMYQLWVSSLVLLVFSLGIYFWRCSSTDKTSPLVLSPFLLEFVFRMDLLMFDVVLETDGIFCELLAARWALIRDKKTYNIVMMWSEYESSYGTHLVDSSSLSWVGLVKFGVIDLICAPCQCTL